MNTISGININIFITGSTASHFHAFPRSITYTSTSSAYTISGHYPFQRWRPTRTWSVREHQNQKYAYGHGALI
jgi:hypothetical protein